MTKNKTTDWSVLQLDGVADIAQKAAAKVAYKFHGVIEHDDLCQEAAVILASNPETVRGYIERDELGLLHHWLWCDLTTTARREARQKNKHIPFDNVRSLAA